MSNPVNREFKNSVFIDLFGQNVYRMQLLRTLHPEMRDVTDADLKTITLKQVITNHSYNDLALQVRDHLMIFVEAQSSWSVNILLRVLLYFADTVQEYLHDHQMDIHGIGRLKLPVPEFYVIYTGKTAVSERITLKKDFYQNTECGLDLEARVITAETEDIIGQYIIFCHVMDEQIHKHGRTRKAAEETIRICRSRNVLVKYLQEREKEVIDIMIMLFDQEYAQEQYGRAQMEEGRKKGRKEGLKEGRKEGRKEGKKEGRKEGVMETLIPLIKDGVLTMKEAASRFGISEEALRKRL